MEKTIEQILAAAKAAGVEVTISTGPKGTGEVAPLPGVRAIPDERRADLLLDDDGSGVVDDH